MMAAAVSEDEGGMMAATAMREDSDGGGSSGSGEVAGFDTLVRILDDEQLFPPAPTPTPAGAATVPPRLPSSLDDCVATCDALCARGRAAAAAHDARTALTSLRAARSRGWDALHAGCWRDALPDLRRATAAAAFAAGTAAALLFQDAAASWRELDAALCIAPPALAAHMHALLPTVAPARTSAGRRGGALTAAATMAATEVPRHHDPLPAAPPPALTTPSVDTFRSVAFARGVPLLVRRGCAHWRALTDRAHTWDNDAYLAAVAGDRVVPVEVGGDYLGAQWGARRMPLAAHLALVAAGDPSAGYLAQHALFEQVPELRDDIATPPYCALGDPSSVDVRAWWGPGGTVSRLHFDTPHNLLAQVVGVKRILLYPPLPPASPAGDMYPVRGALNNTSAVANPLAPDRAAFPRFPPAPTFAVDLAPGDLLYIPPLWWHHVTALSRSASVSFWWHA